MPTNPNAHYIITPDKGRIVNPKWQAWENAQKGISSSGIPKKYATDSRGRRYLNPEYKEYERQQERNKNIEAFKKSGFQLARTTLGRSASQRARGETSTPISQYSAAEQKSIMIEKLNQSALAGRITPAQYQSQLNAINKNYSKVRAEEKKRQAYTSTKRASSEAAKQRESRAVSASQGIAIGTIQKGGGASASLGSSVADISNTRSFVDALKPETRNAGGIKKEDITKEPEYDPYKLGGTQNPIISQQPNFGLISPYLKNPEKQGPPKPETTTLPAGRLQTLYGQPIQEYISRKPYLVI